MASHYGLPVSTTHSVVGGIIGFTIVSKGFECVNWGINGMLGINQLSGIKEEKYHFLCLISSLIINLIFRHCVILDHFSTFNRRFSFGFLFNDSFSDSKNSIPGILMIT